MQSQVCQQLLVVHLKNWQTSTSQGLDSTNYKNPFERFGKATENGSKHRMHENRIDGCRRGISYTSLCKWVFPLVGRAWLLGSPQRLDGSGLTECFHNWALEETPLNENGAPRTFGTTAFLLSLFSSGHPPISKRHRSPSSQGTVLDRTSEAHLA